jgi:hypothetical protein
MPDTITASPYLDTVQAAAYLHHAPRSLNNMRALGTGPRWHKAGGRVLYLRSDLESYIRSGLR